MLCVQGITHTIPSTDTCVWCSPTDYFMRIACDTDGTEKMVGTQAQLWQSTKPAAFTRDMPCADADDDVHLPCAPVTNGGGGDGELRGVQVEGASKVHKNELDIMSAPAVRHSWLFRRCHQNTDAASS